MEQRTPEWFAARTGKVTASRISDVMAKLKSGRPGASRVNYMAELVSERLTGQPYPQFQSMAMKWGTEQEAEARHLYEFMAETTITDASFVPHPSIPNSGASPDGFVGEDGLVEFKCPNTSTHIATLRGAGIDTEYTYQMQWQMACTGRKWCDFASYDPRLPAAMRLHIERVYRDEVAISLIGAEVLHFLVEVEDTTDELRKLYGVKEAA